jgi:hypothetical protein
MLSASIICGGRRISALMLKSSHSPPSNSAIFFADQSVFPVPEK